VIGPGGEWKYVAQYAVMLTGLLSMVTFRGVPPVESFEFFNRDRKRLFRVVRERA
jgi:hypothetical protein